MATAIKKTANPDTGTYDYVRAVDVVNYPSIDWAHNPDISAVDGSVPMKYWEWDGSVVVEMSQANKDIVDSALTGLDELNSDPVAHIYDRTISFTSGETKEIKLPQDMNNMSVHIYDPMSSVLINEQLLSAAGSGPVGWDPDNVGTNDSQINNGSYTDLVYNNTLTGNTSGIIMGIDMLTPTTISAMKRWDYSASYFDTSWEFIGTDDASGATYTVIFSETQSSPNLDPNPFFKAFDPVTFRYYGWRCVTSYNATYTISRELELYSGTLQTVEKELDHNTDYEVSRTSDDTLSITNMKDARDLKIVVVGN